MGKNNNKFEEVRRGAELAARRAIQENWDAETMIFFIRNKRKDFIPQAFEDWVGGWIDGFLIEADGVPMIGEVVDFGHREYFLIHQIKPLVFDCVDLTIKRRCTQFPLAEKSYTIRKATAADYRVVVQVLHKRAGTIDGLDV